MSRDPVNRALIAVNYLDWISPLWAIVQGLVKGRPVRFLVDVDSMAAVGVDDRMLRAILDAHGVETWGYVLVMDGLLVSVRQRQAAHALAVLGQYGIAVLEAFKPLI